MDVCRLGCCVALRNRLEAVPAFCLCRNGETGDFSLDCLPGLKTKNEARERMLIYERRRRMDESSSDEHYVSLNKQQAQL